MSEIDARVRFEVFVRAVDRFSEACRRAQISLYRLARQVEITDYAIRGEWNRYQMVWPR